MLLPFCYHNECFTIEEELYIVHRRSDSHSNMAVSTRERRMRRHEERVDLLKEMIKICHMENSAEKKRIYINCVQEAWNLTVRYGEKKKALKFYFRQWRMGIGWKRWMRITKDLIYIMLFRWRKEQE